MYSKAMKIEVIRDRLYKVPVGSPEFLKLQKALKEAELRHKQTKKYKIKNIVDFYNALYKEEADDWLKNDLQIYIIGFDVNAANNAKEFAKMKKRVSISRMTHEELDGFRKMIKMQNAGVSISDCIQIGTYKRERWSDNVSICKAISPELPENPDNCARILLKELITAWSKGSL